MRIMSTLQKNHTFPPPVILAADRTDLADHVASGGVISVDGDSFTVDSSKHAAPVFVEVFMDFVFEILGRVSGMFYWEG